MGRAADLHCANRKWSDLRLGFLVRGGKRRQARRGESGGKRASAGKGKRRGLENLAACWISFFPLEEIFTSSFVDCRRRLPFKRIDARSGGRKGAGTPRVSVNVGPWQTQRVASLVLSFVKPMTQHPIRLSLSLLSSLLSIQGRGGGQRRRRARKSASIEKLTR